MTLKEAVRAGYDDFIIGIKIEGAEEAFHTDEEYKRYGGYWESLDKKYVGFNNMDLLGFTEESAISDDDELAAGSAIMSRLVIKISNYDGKYSDINFRGKGVFAKIAVRYGDGLSDVSDYVNLKKYIVDDVDTVYGKKIITLTCYDITHELDVVADISENFPMHANLLPGALGINSPVVGDKGLSRLKYITIPTNPCDGKRTKREILSYLAEVSNLYATAIGNSVSEYRGFKFLDVDTGTASDYCTKLNNGTITEEEITDIDVLSDVFSLSLATEKSYYGSCEITYGGTEFTSGTMKNYVYHVTDNPLIDETNAAKIAGNLVSTISSTTSKKSYYKCNATVKSNPLLTAGTPAIIKADDGKYVPIIITRSVFDLGNVNTIVSAAPDLLRNTAKKRSSVEKQIDAAITNACGGDGGSVGDAYTKAQSDARYATKVSVDAVQCRESELEERVAELESEPESYSKSQSDAKYIEKEKVIDLENRIADLEDGEGPEQSPTGRNKCRLAQPIAWAVPQDNSHTTAAGVREEIDETDGTPISIVYVIPTETYSESAGYNFDLSTDVVIDAIQYINGKGKTAAVKIHTQSIKIEYLTDVWMEHHRAYVIELCQKLEANNLHIRYCVDFNESPNIAGSTSMTDFINEMLELMVPYADYVGISTSDPPTPTTLNSANITKCSMLFFNWYPSVGTGTKTGNMMLTADDVANQISARSFDNLCRSLKNQYGLPVTISEIGCTSRWEAFGAAAKCDWDTPIVSDAEPAAIYKEGALLALDGAGYDSIGFWFGIKNRVKSMLEGYIYAG